MPGLVEYEYAFIRFVPRVEREEFINLGVIVYCKKKDYLATRVFINKTKIEALCPDPDLKIIEKYLRTWSLIADGVAAGGFIANLDKASRFRWLTAPRSTILQPSAVRSGLCHDPEETLDELYKVGVV